ncbi:hypothetical protein [Aestuariivirga sp.]|uniref:hypothetical protein n=1 Tax=Aestuariivirga sp. TaxID=2650926 RepID=UPI0035B41012
MNRRKPRLDVAVVPVAAGEHRDAAVLRKAVAAALAARAGQACAEPRLAAGYLAGYARHQALKHGLDAEADGGAALLAALAAQAPEEMAEAVRALRLAPRAEPSSRAALGAADPLADAGYLVGHLESLCGTRKLLATAGGTHAYLTRCDHAADRMQTHHPTAVLRFDPAERAIVEAALRSLE